MSWLVARMKWVMLVSGVLTCTMVYAVIAPEAALRSTFGSALQGPVAEIVVRNWGALIALVGAMLIYGAFHSASRPLVLTVAGLSKLIFVGLVLVHGPQSLVRQVALPITIDLATVALFLAYLIAARRRRSPDGE